MCDSHQEGREWRLYIRDMIDFAHRVLSYTSGLDRDDFVADGRTYDAVLRNIELIGEAATHVPSEVRGASPDIEWRQLIGSRNRIAHAYLGIDDDVIWDIVQNDVPSLSVKLQRLLDSQDTERS